MLAYGGLFAFISGSSFVLQGIYGLDELAYAFSFAFMVWIYHRHPGARLVSRLDSTARSRLGVGLRVRRRTHAGARGFRRTVVIRRHRPDGALRIRRRAHHAAVHGLRAMPFPDAGGRRLLLGLCQMSFAAVLGIGLGLALGQAALPAASRDRRAGSRRLRALPGHETAAGRWRSRQVLNPE